MIFYIIILTGIFYCIGIPLVWYVVSRFIIEFHIGKSTNMAIAFSAIVLSICINNKKGKAIFYDNYVEIITHWQHRTIYFKEIVEITCSYKKGKNFNMKIKTLHDNITIRSSLWEVWNNKQSNNEPELKNVYDKINLLYHKNQKSDKL